MKPARGISNTSVCVRCLKRKAIVHGGHVTVGRRTLLAGWCGPCSRRHSAGFYTGWMGHWRPEMSK